MNMSIMTGKVRIPSGIKATYLVNEKGIVKETNTLDQNGKSMKSVQEMIIPKEAFITAYNTYIKNTD